MVKRLYFNDATPATPTTALPRSVSVSNVAAAAAQATTRQQMQQQQRRITELSRENDELRRENDELKASLDTKTRQCSTLGEQSRKTTDSLKKELE